MQRDDGSEDQRRRQCGIERIPSSFDLDRGMAAPGRQVFAGKVDQRGDLIDQPISGLKCFLP